METYGVSVTAFGTLGACPGHPYRVGCSTLNCPVGPPFLESRSVVQAARNVILPTLLHLLPSARAESDAIRDGRRLQPQRARLPTVGVGVGVGVGQVARWSAKG